MEDVAPTPSADEIRARALARRDPGIDRLNMRINARRLALPLADTPQRRAMAEYNRNARRALAERALAEPRRIVHTATPSATPGRMGRTGSHAQGAVRGAAQHPGARSGSSGGSDDPPDGDLDPEPSPAALAEAQRILDGAARRILAERLAEGGAS